MFKIKSEGKFEIKNRGVVYSIKDQNVTVGDVNVGDDIEINGKIYTIKGIESYAIAEPSRSQLTEFAILTDEPTKEMTHKVHLGDEKFWDLSEKREALKKKQWIKNVVRIQGISEEEAEKLYKRIKENERA